MPRSVRLLTENRLVRALRGPPGLPPDDVLGKRMLSDDALDRAVRRVVDRLQAENVGFQEDGTCAASVTLDLADIHRIVGARGLRLVLPPIYSGRLTDR
jgi:hypothetical protein